MFKEQIFKTNDIRGAVTGADPELDLDGSRKLGTAFTELLDLSGETLVMNHDMWWLGEELFTVFVDGTRRARASIVSLGLTSADLSWLGSRQLDPPGMQFIASHNPARYSSMKLCLASTSPVRLGFTAELREHTVTVTTGEKVVGDYEKRDLTAEFVAHPGRLVSMTGQRRLKVVVDTGNGMAGLTVPKALANREVGPIGLHTEPNSTFLNHPANPLESENLVNAHSAAHRHSMDLRLVFDDDADRCFLIDGRGEVVDPLVVTVMTAVAEPSKETGGTVVVNAIASQAVADAVAGLGNVEVLRVRYAFVRALTAERNAVFGGERSAHYCFRDLWEVNTGVLAALHVLERLRSSTEPLSTLTARFDGYKRSGEINSIIIGHWAMMKRVAKALEGRSDVEC